MDKEASKATDRATSKPSDKGKELHLDLKYTLQAKVELFKAAATFGFLVAVVLCIGVPVMFSYATGLHEGLQHLATAVSMLVGVIVAIGVMCAYCCATRRLTKSGCRGKP